MKMRILIGSLSGPNFPIRTAKMDHSQINFGELPFHFTERNNSFLLSRNVMWTISFQLNVHQNDVRKVK